MKQWKSNIAIVALVWNDKKYHLPDATYCTDDEAGSVKSIGQKVCRAASQVDKEFGYIVVPLNDADFNLVLDTDIEDDTFLYVPRQE